MNHRITAARLIAPEILQKMDGNIRTKISERDRDIIKRVLSGESYGVVGAEFGLSREGIRTVCFRTFRRLKFKL